MKENKLTITINKPIDYVFEFTTNPKNTPLWFSTIAEEKASQFPPEIGTIYQNRPNLKAKWNYYTVIDYKENETFILADSENNYHVKYTYKKLSDNKTELEYFEWVKNGKLDKPFTLEKLEKLNEIL